MYVSEKQLGNVLTVQTLDDGDVISTSAEMNDVRAIIIFQNTNNGANVTVAQPASSTPKLVHLINRGGFPLTVENILLEPGPTYGLFWTGSAWSPVSAEGVGVVSNIDNSNAITLSGDGSPIDPLIAELVLSAAANNGLQILNDGLYYQNVVISPNRLLVVDTASGSDTFAGTLNAPFKTIQKAIDTVLPFGLILVVAGSYTEALQIPAGKNFIVEGLGGANDSAVVTLNGIIRNTAGAIGARFKNLNVKAPAGQGSALEIQDALGGFLFDNVSFSVDAGSDQSETVHIIDGNTSWYVFIDGSIKGGLKVSGTNNGASVALSRGSETPDLYIDDAEVTVTVSYQSYLGDIDHLNGNLFIKSVAAIGSITSSANAPNLLGIHDSSMFNTSNGSWGALTKTGTAFHTIDLKRGPNPTALTGTPLWGSNAVDIHADFDAPVAYSINGPSVTEHLKGIDTALANVGGGLSAVTHDDTATVGLSGAGTIASPLEADLKISAAPGNALTTQPDGAFVATADVGLEEVTHADSDTVIVTGDGTPSDPLIAEVVVSAETHNLLESRPTGLYVTQPTPFFDICVTAPYHILDDEIVFDYKATGEYTLPQGLVGSQISLIPLDDPNSPNPADPDPIPVDFTITLQKVNTLNVATTIGTIVFDTAGVGIVTTFNNPVGFVPGERLTAITDAEGRFRNLSIALKAQRPYTN